MVTCLTWRSKKPGHLQLGGSGSVHNHPSSEVDPSPPATGVYSHLFQHCEPGSPHFARSLSFWVIVFSGCEPSHWETRVISTKYEQCDVFRWFSKALLCLDFCGPTISSSFFMFGKTNRNPSSLLALCLFLCWLSNLYGLFFHPGWVFTVNNMVFTGL